MTPCAFVWQMGAVGSGVFLKTGPTNLVIGQELTRGSMSGSLLEEAFDNGTLSFFVYKGMTTMYAGVLSWPLR